MVLRNQKSYNEIIYSYIKSLSKSSSFSPKRKKEEKNINNNMNHKKNSFVKVSGVNNKINLKFFKNKNTDNDNKNNILIKKKMSHPSPKMIDMKLYTKKLSNKKIEKNEMNNNNPLKVNRKSIKSKNVKIITPEENHYLAVFNIQKIKSYGTNIS